MPKIDAVVFDADGTMFDTKSLIFDAYSYVAELYGYPAPTQEQVTAQMGKSIPEIMAALFPGVDVTAMEISNREYVVKNASKALAFSGLVELLDELRTREIKIAVLTSGSAKVHNLLEHHQVTDYFSSVVFNERVSKPKPDPEGFMLAMKEMGTSKHASVMVGDMVPDIEVGKKVSALATVGVTHGFGTRESLQSAKADYIIDSLADLISVIDELEARS